MLGDEEETPDEEKHDSTLTLDTKSKHSKCDEKDTESVHSMKIPASTLMAMVAKMSDSEVKRISESESEAVKAAIQKEQDKDGNVEVGEIISEKDGNLTLNEPVKGTGEWVKSTFGLHFLDFADAAVFITSYGMELLMNAVCFFRVRNHMFGFFGSILCMYQLLNPRDPSVELLFCLNIEFALFKHALIFNRVFFPF